jgi:glyoxalase family protein
MKGRILGLHHITAIAGNALRNHDFYTRVMGLRLVKKTVNFDDPGTYHFYFGNETGAPGTLLTFFPWEHAQKGVNSVGMATDIAFSVPEGSLGFWKDRLDGNGVAGTEHSDRFGESAISFTDPDGLGITLLVAASPDERQPWQTPQVPPTAATHGFHSTTLSLRKIDATASILTDIFGYRLLGQEGNRYRFITDAVPAAAVIDLLEIPNGHMGRSGTGTNHHIAFRVADDETQMAFREAILAKGLHITPQIDRDYFHSLYFREPGGVLFELATDNPGFTVDEPLAELGMHLKLPRQHEGMRAEIEKALPPIN